MDKIGGVVYLPQQYQVYHLTLGSNLITAEIKNHGMDAVKDAIREYNS